MDSHEPPNIPSNLSEPISIGTQTKNSSNVGQEFKHLKTKRLKNSFDDITIEISSSFY